MMGRLLDYVLGGSVVATAGDGYAAVPQPKRTRKMIQSPTLGANNPFDNRYQDPLSTLSKDPSLSQGDHADNEVRIFNKQHLENEEVWQTPANLLSGVSVTRESPLSASATPSRSSMESFHTAPETFPMDASPCMLRNSDDVPWEMYEIPEELLIMNSDTPKYIENVIRESFDHHRALRASRMQVRAISIQNSPEDLDAIHESPFPAESSAAASARSTSTGRFATSSMGTTIESSTTAESDAHHRIGQHSPNTVFETSAVPFPATGTSGGEGVDRFLKKSGRRLQKRKESPVGRYKLLPRWMTIRENREELPKLNQTVSECTGCMDEFIDTNTISLSCKHRYCSPCLSQLITTSIKSEASYPPKCCLTEISATIIRKSLPSLVYTQYKEKALEYAVPAANRFYCVSATCGKWINTHYANLIHSTLECTHCTTKLCLLCRGPHHLNQDCPQDLHLVKTLQQAEGAGWRRCHNCRTMVELKYGCRHITCRCGAEFCYTCGSVWGTCRCTSVDQQRREREVRRRLRRYEAEERAERKEIEAAERVLREEREAEERRVEEEMAEVRRREEERLGRVEGYFGYLRGMLERVCWEQVVVMERRHEWELGGSRGIREEVDSIMKSDERGDGVRSERNKIIANTEASIKVCQRHHAFIMGDTILRQSNNRNDSLASSRKNPAPNINPHPSKTPEYPSQHETNNLTTPTSSEYPSTQNRQHRTLTSLTSPSALKPQNLPLQIYQKGTTDIDNQESKLRNMVVADRKWADVLREARVAMLMEEKGRVMGNGGDVPDVRVERSEKGREGEGEGEGVAWEKAEGEGEGERGRRMEAGVEEGIAEEWEKWMGVVERLEGDGYL